MTLYSELVEESLGRPRREVDRLVCVERCGRCWACVELPKRVVLAATDRLVDVTSGLRSATVVVSEAAPWSEGELARPWLRRVRALGATGRGMARSRVPFGRVALGHLKVLPPRWFDGVGGVGEWVYVDLKGAYPSIYTRLALDMVWRPDDERPVLGVGRMAFVGHREITKPVHRRVGGILRATEMRVIRLGEPETRSTVGWSTYLAPDLWGVIMAVLHCVADRAVEHGAVMWDTDGGIVPADRADALIRAVEEQWGCVMRVRARGRGRVWGVKHWQIGEIRTMQAGRRRVLRGERTLVSTPPAARRLLETAMTCGR